MTWLHVPGLKPSTSSRSALVTGGSISAYASRCRLLARSVGWRGKLRQHKSWSRACRKGGWIRLLFGQMPRPSEASRGVESWIASLRESRANLGASQESSVGSKTIGTSASTLSAPLARWDQASSSWRTSPGLFDSEPPTFSGDWPTSGSMQNGACSPRPESVPLIDGRECSSWPTATAGDSGATASAAYSTDSGRHSGTTLTDAMRGWSTPRASDGEKGSPNQSFGAGGTPLPAQAALWATPRTISGGPESAKRKKELGRTESGGGDLQSQAQAWATPTARDWKAETPEVRPGHSPALSRQVLQKTGLESPIGSTPPSPEETERSS